MVAGAPLFRLSGDDDGRWPILVTSPHSGRDYPAAFLAQSRLTLSQLRRAEDAFVDVLLDGIAGVPVLRALRARSWLDLNRAPDDLDPAMFDGPTGLPTAMNERVAAGLGVLPRMAGQGLDIYPRPLPAAEAEARLAALHRPWHASITSLLARARARHGHAILIDCHSMPSPGGPRPPQIVIGDCHGTSAAPALVALIERHFGALGWRVARNAPYAGGYTTRHHGRPLAGVHAIQIEIDRALYMDSQRLTPHRGMTMVTAAMTSLVRRLLTEAPALGLDAPWAEAAE